MVKFQGFGKFEVKDTKERVGRNPQNGNEYMIPAHKAVKFKAGEKLNKIMNSKKLYKARLQPFKCRIFAMQLIYANKLKMI